MTPAESPPTPPYRKSLFRRVALARYRSPIETDTPDILEAWRPGLLWAALAIIAIAAIAAWAGV